MASEGRDTRTSLERQLYEEGHRFDFFQAVRLLRRLGADPGGAEGPARAAEDAVRFRSVVSLAFPASEIYEIRRPGDRAYARRRANDRPPDPSAPAEMLVTFMGMFGPSGVLPWHYTELLLDRLQRKDTALLEFLDIFTHRFVSLFYRAWEKHRFAFAYEDADPAAERFDRFSLWLFALLGMGTDGLRGHLGVRDRALLYYAGLLSRGTRSAAALAGLLGDYFAVPVEVVQPVGQWLPLAAGSRTCLGRTDGNTLLGDGAILGRWVWDQQARFRVRVGPIGYEDFVDLLPSGRAFGPLVQLTRFVVGQPLDFQVQLVLRGAEVPRCQLGRDAAYPARLGWSTWLKTREFDHDAEDALFDGALTSLGSFPDERGT